jgi:hypothetical protein
VKRTLLIASVAGLFGIGAFGTSVSLGTFAVSAAGTFLEQSSNDNCSFGTAFSGCTAASFNPTFVDLATMGVNPGDTLEIIPMGTMCFLPGSPCGQGPANLGGVFDSNNTLLSSNVLNRLPGAIQTSLPNITSPLYDSYYGSINTAIPQDFSITDAYYSNPFCNLQNNCPVSPIYFSVVVPVGAVYLVLGSLDSFYADNTGNISVQLIDLGSSQPPTVPEPTEYVMVLTGLGAVAMLRRKIRL